MVGDPLRLAQIVTPRTILAATTMPAGTRLVFGLVATSLL